jgi:UPF0716 family protein affecting phage T7 exclusion
VRLPRSIAGLLLFAAWIAAEIVAFNLVSSWVGGGLAFFLLVMKSVLGAVLVKRLVSAKIVDMIRRRQGPVVLEGAGALDAFLKGIGGALLIVPGFAAGLAGLALLTPSVRRLLVRHSAGKAATPREIDLTEGDWREMPQDGAKRLRRERGGP